MPTIIQNLGYTALNAQLYSVPPYAVASVFTVLNAFASDKMHLRGPMALCFLPIAVVGYVILTHTTSNNVQYGMLFLICTGIFSAIPPIIAWLANNYTEHYARATAIAVQIMAANAGGLVGIFIYAPNTDFTRSHTIVMGLLAASFVMVLLKCGYLVWMNKRKASGKEDKWRGCGDDRDPDFKFVI